MVVTDNKTGFVVQFKLSVPNWFIWEIVAAAGATIVTFVTELTPLEHPLVGLVATTL